MAAESKRVVHDHIRLPQLAADSEFPSLKIWLPREIARKEEASSYPVLVEPFLPLRVQTWTWSIGYVLFVVLCATTAWRYRAGDRTALIEASESGGDAPDFSERGLWFGLAALPSAMLLAVTNPGDALDLTFAEGGARTRVEETH